MRILASCSAGFPALAGGFAPELLAAVLGPLLLAAEEDCDVCGLPLGIELDPTVYPFDVSPLAPGFVIDV